MTWVSDFILVFHIFFKSRGFFGILLLFCFLGTLIDLIMEEQKELNAAKDIVIVHSVNGSRATEPTTSQPDVSSTNCGHQNLENVTPIIINSDDYPLLTNSQFPNTSFSTPGRFNRNTLKKSLSFLSLKMLTLWSKLH